MIIFCTGHFRPFTVSCTWREARDVEQTVLDLVGGLAGAWGFPSVKLGSKEQI